MPKKDYIEEISICSRHYVAWIAIIESSWQRQLQLKEHKELKRPYLRKFSNILCCKIKGSKSLINIVRSEEFELTAYSLRAHMNVTESSLGMGHDELILRTFI